MEDKINENFGDAQIQNVDMEDTANENFEDAQIQDVDMEDTLNENVDMEDTLNENFEDAHAQIQDVDMEDTINFTSLWIYTNTRFVNFTRLMKILNINFLLMDNQIVKYFLLMV